VKRELLIAGAAAAIVAGVASCSNDSKTPTPSSSSATSASAATSSTTSSTSGTLSSSAPAAAGTDAKVTVGGQPLPVSGPVDCSTHDGRFSIAIGEVITGVIVGLEPDGSAVHYAGLGTVNGVVMSFTEGAPGNNATATKSGNTYHIAGTATGVDDKNGQQISQPFTVDATCP
jgi:lipoprotein LpqH